MNKRKIKHVAKSILPPVMYYQLVHLYHRLQKGLKPWYWGLTSAQEQEYFEKYAREIYSGLGEIVDLGCWLGSTTISLAKGLSQRRNLVKVNKKVHAFDQFIWSKGMAPYYHGLKLYKEGESFLPEFIERTKNWSSLIEIHEGDLRTIKWDGSSIEFLLIDAMKSWELANSILQEFFPYLIPGHSYIVHQDFKHYYTSWIHLLNYRFREHFAMVYSIPHSASIVLRYIKPLKGELLNISYSFESFSFQEIDAAFNYSMSLVPKKEQSNIAAAKVMLYIQMNNIEKAKKELRQFLDLGVSPTSDMTIVMDMLDM